MSKGFTLMEMLIALAVLAILATLVMPSAGYRNIQNQVVESIELVEGYKPTLEAAFRVTGKFPLDNEAAGMPAPEKLIGNYLESVSIENGVINLKFGRKFAKSLQGKLLSIRPLVVEDSAISPISWVCGYDEIPEGMVAAGDNQTNLDIKYLPLRCR